MTSQTDEAWSRGLAAKIGHRVQRQRQSASPRVSAQTLADRTEELGHPLSRATIAALESGRRGTVTVADLIVLSRALNVPPVVLVFPIGEDENTELLPGLWTETMRSVDWWSGMRQSTLTTPAVLPLTYLRRHDDSIRAWGSHQIMAIQAIDDQTRDNHNHQVEAFRLDVLRTRDELRQLGLPPPALPSGFVDDQETGEVQS